jgi:hypothetical protein
MNDLNGAGPVHNGSKAAAWLRYVSQQIQVLDYQLHTALRIFASGKIDSEHAAAFMQASAKRDRLMASVFSCLVEEHKNQTVNRRKFSSGAASTVGVVTAHENEELSKGNDPVAGDEGARNIIEFPASRSRHSRFESQRRSN